MTDNQESPVEEQAVPQPKTEMLDAVVEAEAGQVQEKAVALAGDLAPEHEPHEHLTYDTVKLQAAPKTVILEPDPDATPPDDWAGLPDTPAEADVDLEPGLEPAPVEDSPAESSIEPGIMAEARPTGGQPSREPDFPPVEVEPPPKRGWGCLKTVGLGLVSAIAGALLALLVLWILNGTLDFRTATDLRVRDEAYRLDADIRSVADELKDLGRQVEEISNLAERVDETQAGVRGLRGELITLQAHLDNLGKDLGSLETAMTGLQDDLGAVEDSMVDVRLRTREVEYQLQSARTELREIRQETQRFDGFLDGLRGLLRDAEPQPEAVPTHPWATPAGEPESPTATPSP